MTLSGEATETGACVTGFQGKTALVTGGTRGIGAAIAEKLAEEGAKVLVTGRTKPQADSRFEFHAVDFSDPRATEAFARQMASAGIDILVNNAGINQISPFENIDPTVFERIQRVNVHAPMHLMKAVIPHMKSRKWGRIINISSIFGTVTKEFRGPYSASKFALDGMTAALAAEVAQNGILANCVSPGVVETDLTRDVLGESGIEAIKKTIPMRRLAQPQEIAEFVFWLASDKNTYISGQNLLIDGGFTRV